MIAAGGEARLVVAAGAALLLAVMIVTAYLLTDALEAARVPLAALEARYAQLAGLRAVGPQIEAGLAEITEMLARHAHLPASGADRVGTDLQQRVRGVAEEAGMRMTGSQILPVREATGFSQIPVTVTVEGSLAALRGMLLGLANETPSVQIDGIVIQGHAREGMSDAPDDAPLTVQMNLSVLQLQP